MHLETDPQLDAREDMAKSMNAWLKRGNYVPSRYVCLLEITVKAGKHNPVHENEYPVICTTTYIHNTPDEGPTNAS